MVPHCYIGIDFGSSKIRISSLTVDSSVGSRDIRILPTDGRSIDTLNVMSVKKGQTFFGNGVKSNSDGYNTVYYIKELLGETSIKDEWKDNTGMRYPIRVSQNGLYDGLEISLEFKNNTKTPFSVEYIVSLILKFCIDAIKPSIGDIPYSVAYPCFWSSEKIQALRCALQLADMDNVQLVPDYVAIAYSYCCCNADSSKETYDRVCCFSMGYSYTMAFVFTFFQDVCFITDCAVSTNLGGQYFDEVFQSLVKKELEKAKIDWNELANGKYAAQFHKIMVRAKDDLCSEGFDSCYLNLEQISDYDNLELFQSDFFKMINDKKLVNNTLSTLLDQVVKDHVDFVCLCGSSIRHKLVRESLNSLVKKKGSRISEILHMDEAVVRGLALAQVKKKEKTPYHYVNLNTIRSYYDYETQSEKLMALEKQSVNTEAHKEYRTQYSEFAGERKDVENASQKYREEIAKATKLLEEIPVERRAEGKLTLTQYDAIYTTGSSTVIKTKKSFEDFSDSLKEFQKQLEEAKDSVMPLMYFVPLRLSDEDMKNVGLEPSKCYVC